MSSSLPRVVLTKHRALTIFMLLTIMGTCFLYILVRNYGLFLSVPDEWEYSKSARLLPLNAVTVPSYLYFFVFRLTSFCDGGFLECARLINSVSFVCAAPFIYLVARRVCTRPVALFITLLAIFGPVSTYTAYFMPESAYFLLFWILAWCALSLLEARPLLYGATLGVIVGSMELIKVHAVFLFPVVVAFSTLRYIHSGVRNPIRRAITASIAFLSVAFSVRFGLGYIFAGRAGLNLFGVLYGSVASSSLGSKHYIQVVLQAVMSLEGHVMALSSLFALPLAALFCLQVSGVERERIDLMSRDIRLFTFLVFACLLPVTAFFTASAASSNGVETIARLHMRYYNFALPLLLIVAAEQLRRLSKPTAYYRALLPAAAFGLLSVLAIKSLLLSYTPGIVDSPELRGLTTNGVIFDGIAVAGLLALGAWIFDRRFGAKMFVFFVFPLSVVFSGYYANIELRQRMVADSYAEAGIFTRQYVGRGAAPTVVVGADHSSLYRTLFYLDSASAIDVVVPGGGRIDEASIPANARWLLVIGDQVLPKSARAVVSFGGFTLARVGSEEVQELDFKVGSWPGIITKKQGLSNPEPWGTWSDGNVVLLKFSKPLPREFTLVLNGHTIGNTDQPSTIVVGDERREIRLPSPQELAFPFKTDGSVDSIVIEIPWARSLQELGVSQDARRLGIGFVSMRIIAKVPAVTP